MRVWNIIKQLRVDYIIEKFKNIDQNKIKKLK